MNDNQDIKQIFLACTNQLLHVKTSKKWPEKCTTETPTGYDTGASESS